MHTNFSNEFVNVDFKVTQDQPFIKFKVHCERVAEAAPLSPAIIFTSDWYNDSSHQDGSETYGTTTEYNELESGEIEVEPSSTEEYEEVEVEAGY